MANAWRDVSHVTVCVCVCVCERVCVCMQGFACTRPCMHAYARFHCVYVGVCMHVCVRGVLWCLCVCVCVCVCMCVCVMHARQYVYAWRCMHARTACTHAVRDVIDNLYIVLMNTIQKTRTRCNRRRPHRIPF